MSKLDNLRDFTGGQLAALIHHVGGIEAAKQILQGNVAVTLSEVSRKLFDKKGRGIPYNLKASVCNPVGTYKLSVPDVSKELFYEQAFIRAKEYRLINRGRHGMTFPDYLSVINLLVEKIGSDKSVANLLNGAWVPLIIPNMKVRDQGRTVRYLWEVAGKSYIDKFPGHHFYCPRERDLDGKITISPGSRYDRLIASMAEAPVPAIYFIGSMVGFSIDAQREFVQRLPEYISLTGAIEHCVYTTMYPTDNPSRQYIGYDCSAIAWRDDDCSLCFQSWESTYELDSKDYLRNPYGNCSGGLLVF